MPGRTTNIRLPLLESDQRPSALRSRNAPRRALVLAFIHVLALVHVIHWMVRGRTVTPIEPSESMKTLELGEVNAGAIFFALAILSTLVLGRLFCGWGCHLVALQDGCGWMMKKLGVKPQPFRSRLLVLMPLLLALYMFVWPTIKRLVVGPLLEPVWPTIHSDLRIGTLPPTGFVNHLQTNALWESLPGIAIAIPFLLICGFACVYFLGSKGFCTYGCPYGGIFGVVDQLSAGRIVVDHDKCHQCASCTDRCTSNVLVNEEIKAYGMVVDPGCMKCMDCVSICPTGALSLKLARPSLFKKKAKGPRPPRSFDTTLGQDVALLLAFLLITVSLRGAYDVIPLLMAIGIAACATFLAWKTWQTARAPRAMLLTLRLKTDGRAAPAGIALVSLTIVGALLVLHTGLVNALHQRAEMLQRRVPIALEQALTGATDLTDEQQRWVRASIRADQRAASLGLIDPRSAVARRAYTHLLLGERERTEQLLRALLDEGRASDALVADLGRIVSADHARAGEAIDLMTSMLGAHPDWWRTRETRSLLLLSHGSAQIVIDESRESLREMDGQPLRRGARARTRIALSRALAASGDGRSALDQLRIAAEEAPDDAVVRENLAAALYQIDHDIDGAIRELRAAISAAPRDPDLHFQLGRLRLEQGEVKGARRAFDHALILDPSAARQRAIDALLEQSR